MGMVPCWPTISDDCFHDYILDPTIQNEVHNNMATFWNVTCKNKHICQLPQKNTSIDSKMLWHRENMVIMRIIIMTVPFVYDQLVMIQVGSVWVPEAWVDQRVLRRQGSHKGRTLKDELFHRIKMKKITCAYSSLSCIIEGQSSNLVVA